MKKRWINLLAICVIFLLPLSVAASAPLLVDDAQLLTRQEYAEVEAQLEATSQQLQMDVVVVTVSSLGGRSAMQYADDYYDSHGYSADGVLLLVSMAEREWWISTSGRAIDTLSDADLDTIGYWFSPYLSSGDYAAAFMEYAGDVATFADEGGIGFGTVLISLMIGVVTAFIVTGVMKGKLKSVRRQDRATGYMCAGGLKLTVDRDLFLFRNVTRRVKPKSNSTTTHRSSSGRSHGGRGGGF